jgi:hypothetical protein
MVSRWWFGHHQKQLIAGHKDWQRDELRWKSPNNARSSHMFTQMMQATGPWHPL